RCLPSFAASFRVTPSRSAPTVSITCLPSASRYLIRQTTPRSPAYRMTPAPLDIVIALLERLLSRCLLQLRAEVAEPPVPARERVATVAADPELRVELVEFRVHREPGVQGLRDRRLVAVLPRAHVEV